jgi:hypothetical protein
MIYDLHPHLAPAIDLYTDYVRCFKARKEEVDLLIEDLFVMQRIITTFDKARFEYESARAGAQGGIETDEKLKARLFDAEQALSQAAADLADDY